MFLIVLYIIGLAVIVVAAILVYKTARDTGRSGILWAFLLVGLGLTLQFVVPIIATVVMVLVYQASPSTMPESMMMEEIDSYAWLFILSGLALSFVSAWAIMRFVSRIPEEGPGSSAPPPPPTFGENF